MKGLFFLPLLGFGAVYAQTDTIASREIEAVSFVKRLPVSKEVINVEKDLRPKNLGQDLPVLLKNQISVVATSDAGNGVGYTGWRIRGTDGQRINVMLNGVPYNDSESQGTYFVDVPDLTSSASQIVIQRGVGTSTNGTAAFGASVNILTKDPDAVPYLATQQSYGSFNTRKHSFEAGSGKFLKDKLSLMSRISLIKSDGYVDRASSDLKSYQASALFEDGNTRVKLMSFGGKEKTYQSWNGVAKSVYESNPTFNISGAIFDENWENIVGFYDNETDNYSQTHNHLVWQQRLSDLWNTETTLHYTKGKGFYENYKQGDPLTRYNLTPFTQNGETVEYTDFIRRKWLDNDFYGVVSNLNGQISGTQLNFGLAANQYFGRHFGQVNSVEKYAQIPADHEYYRNSSLKNELSGFAKAIYKLGVLEFFGDIQLRNISYLTQIITQGDYEGADLEKNWLFFNPKAGVSALIFKGKVFLSYAIAHREPNRDDLFSNPDTKPEKLGDLEFGIEKQWGRTAFTLNGYLMNYTNQLVLSGAINNIGEFIRVNSGKSYRAGIELGAISKLSEKVELAGNLSFSRNKNIDFKIEGDNKIKNLGNTDISFSPDVIANAILLYKPIEKLNLRFTNQFIGKQYLDNTENEENTLPEYFVSDFSADYLFKMKNNDLSLQLLVNNLWNASYINNGYLYDEPYYFPQAGRNFLIGLSYKFQK